MLAAPAHWRRCWYEHRRTCDATSRSSVVTDWPPRCPQYPRKDDYRGLHALLDIGALNSTLVYNEVVSTFGHMVPAITAVLVLQPPGGATTTDGAMFGNAVRTARAAAKAIGRERGAHIDIFCMRRSPLRSEPAIVPLRECTPSRFVAI